MIAAALTAGLVAGTLDGAAASLQTWLTAHRTPDRVFLFIATGVFGREALQRPGLWPWGLLFHYVIATGWATLFTALFPMLPPRARRPLLLGPAYGVMVSLIMSTIVLPLSNVPYFVMSPLDLARATGILVVCVGLPIALIVSRGLRDAAY
jgi:hypothetical protein